MIPDVVVFEVALVVVMLVVPPEVVADQVVLELLDVLLEVVGRLLVLVLHCRASCRCCQLVLA